MQPTSTRPGQSTDRRIDLSAVNFSLPSFRIDNFFTMGGGSAVPGWTGVWSERPRRREGSPISLSMRCPPLFNLVACVSRREGDGGSAAVVLYVTLFRIGRDLHRSPSDLTWVSYPHPSFDRLVMVGQVISCLLFCKMRARGWTEMHFFDCTHE